MKRASLIASLVCAAYAGALPALSRADTRLVATAPPLAATNAAAPASPASAASATTSRKRTAGKRRALAVAATTHARASEPDDTPFAFRGIPLGITLAAMREASMVRATPHESELLCETDIAGSDIGMAVKSDASLTVACRWAHHTAQGWTPSRAVVDGAPAADHILRFTHASPGEPLHLYEMSFVVDGVTAFDLRDLLASRYGKPRVLGAPSLPLLVWDNATSTITICLLPDSRRATLTYLLKPAPQRTKGAERTLKMSQFDEG
jgi:hypothetical protein